MSIRDRIAIAGLKLASALVKQDELSELAMKIMPGAKKTAPVRGTKEILQAYNTMPWLRAVVNKVSRSMASVEWKALTIRQADTGRAVKIPKLMSADFKTRKEIIDRFSSSKQFIVEELETHPILDFITSGNPYFPGLVSLQLTQQYLDLVGESFWIIERNMANKPMSYFPMPPSWVSSTPTLKDPRFGFKMGGNNEEVFLPAQDVIWFYEPNPNDPYTRGTGTARALADELDTDEYAAKYVKDKFFNQARPDLLITAEGLQKDETDRLEEGWNSKFQGLGKQSKTSFINRKVDVKDLSPKFTELQLVELRQHERDTIFHVYGMPPELFGVLDNSNRATIESAEFLYAKHVMLPRLEFLRSVLQWRLAKEYDERLILDFESPVDEDEERQLQAAEKAPWALKVNEWRKKAGVAPLEDNEGGNAHMVPFNLMPVENLNNLQDMYEDSGKEGDNKKDDDKKIVTPHKHVHVVEKVKPLDPDLLSALDGDVLRSVTILDDDAVRTSTWRVVESKLADILEVFGSRAIAEAGVDIAFEETARVVDWIRRNGVKRSSLYDRTTQRSLALTLSEGVNNGESLKQLSKRIELLYDDIIGSRALTIAKTESVRAANFGSIEGMRQAGIDKHEWLTTRDSAVRDAHASLDGEVVEVGSFFTVTEGDYAGSQTDYPGNFNVGALDINCRCAVIPVFDGQRSYLDTEAKRVAGWKSFDADRTVQERQLRRVVRQSLAKQKEIVLRVLRGEDVSQ